jgi:hypothetical protein
MMSSRARPTLGSITIRRLVLPAHEQAPGLSDTIAAAVSRRLGGRITASTTPSGLAESIAHGIAGREELASLVGKRKLP